MKPKLKRCAWCGSRIWGVARAYGHVFNNTLMLQVWVHDNGKKSRGKGCAQKLTERITKTYVDTQSMDEAVAPYLKYDSRAADGTIFTFQPDA